MNTSSPILVVVVSLALIGGGWGALLRVKSRQHAGIPGVRISPIPTRDKSGALVRSNSVALPLFAPGYRSNPGDIDDTELRTLPPDTTFGRVIYEKPDSPLKVQTSVILMGADRTSIHQPEFCLTGNGWAIRDRSTRRIPFDRIEGGGLDVRRFDSRIQFRNPDGTAQEAGSVYVFWFVADGQWTASHWTRTLWMTRDLLTDNVLQRWAYISYFAVCEPGKEDATFEQVCDLIRTTVPKFQISGIHTR